MENELIEAAVLTAQGRTKALKDAAMIGDSGYDRIEADHYPTPPEYLDCLVQHVKLHENVWECASGEGNLSLRLHEFGHTVWSSDIIDYGLDERFSIIDFLQTTKLPDPSIRAIVTNPPYETIDVREPEWEHLADRAAMYGLKGKVSLAEFFARHACHVMEPVRGQVALFLRNEFDCSKGRMDLFGLPPFHKKVVVTRRPRWIADSKGSPRHNYSWFVWDWRHKAGNGGVAYSHPDFAAGPK